MSAMEEYFERMNRERKNKAWSDVSKKISEMNTEAVPAPIIDHTRMGSPAPADQGANNDEMQNQIAVDTKWKNLSENIGTVLRGEY